MSPTICIMTRATSFGVLASDAMSLVGSPGATNGGYMVYNGPRKLAHGDSLEDVLRVFDRKLRLLLGS